MVNISYNYTPCAHTLHAAVLYVGVRENSFVSFHSCVKMADLCVFTTQYSNSADRLKVNVKEGVE